jgi:hypothetical protein
VSGSDPLCRECRSGNRYRKAGVFTFSLPGGQIAAQLLTTPGPAPKPFAVTGGSGDYRNARGEGTLVEYGKRKGSVTFRLTGT